MTMLWAVWFLGCGSSGDRAEEVKSWVSEQLAAARVAGTIGVPVFGKGVWYTTTAFDSDCLMEKDLAFVRDVGAKGARISPTYDAQTSFQATIDGGYCIAVGEDLDFTVAEPQKRPEGGWSVPVAFRASNERDWWKCLDTRQLSAHVLVNEDAARFSMVKRPILADDHCPRPLRTANPDRIPRTSSSSAPSGPPSADDVRGLMGAFDRALANGDPGAALDLVSCFNLFEKVPYGACSAAEVITLGPLPSTESARRHAPPWSMGAFKDFSTLGRPFADRQNATWFHVPVAPASKGRPGRTATVQWTGDAWKLVGVVQRKAEGLTTMELVNDLDRSDKRAIFERRMKGEPIGPDGHPLDPNAELVDE